MIDITKKLEEIDNSIHDLTKDFEGYQENNEKANQQLRGYIEQANDLLKQASNERDYFTIKDKIRLYRVLLRLHFKDVISLSFIPPPRISKN